MTTPIVVSPLNNANGMVSSGTVSFEVIPYADGIIESYTTPLYQIFIPITVGIGYTRDKQSFQLCQYIGKPRDRLASAKTQITRDMKYIIRKFPTHAKEFERIYKVSGDRYEFQKFLSSNEYMELYSYLRSIVKEWHDPDSMRDYAARYLNLHNFDENILRLYVTTYSLTK